MFELPKNGDTHALIWLEVRPNENHNAVIIPPMSTFYKNKQDAIDAALQTAGKYTGFSNAIFNDAKEPDLKHNTLKDADPGKCKIFKDRMPEVATYWYMVFEIADLPHQHIEPNEDGDYFDANGKAVTPIFETQ